MTDTPVAAILRLAMLDSVDLLTLDEPVSGPASVVYSTSPRTATTEDTTYFVKGPELEVVFSEMAGCLLARAVGLSVPRVAVCHFGGQKYCGSEKVSDIGRNVAPLLRKPATVTNFAELYAAVVVDCWLANTDRNLGNIVAESVSQGKVSFRFIDFEKSAALRPNPIINSGLVSPKSLWPREELGRELRGTTKPLHPPSAIVSEIMGFVGKTGAVAAIIDTVVQRLQPVDWAESCVEAVVRRGRRIAEHAEEVWGL